MIETKTADQTFRISLRMVQEENYCYSFPLFIPDNNLLSRKIPVITFLFNEELVKDPSTFRISGKDLVRLAFDALRKKASHWQQNAADGNAPHYVIAKSENGDSVAEKILDVDFMEQAKWILQCDKLEVTIPHTGAIIARKPESASTAFEQALKKELLCPAFPQLSDIVFIYANGQITDTKKRIQAQSENGNELFVETDSNSLKVIKIPVFTGDFFYKIEIGAATDDMVLELCEKVVFYMLKTNAQFKGFLGIIEFVINRQTNPYNSTFDTKLTRFWQLLEESQQMSELVRQMKKNVEVSILFGEHLMKGEAYRRKYFKVKYVR